MENALFWLSVNCRDDVKYIARKCDNKTDSIKNEEAEDSDAGSSVNSATTLPVGTEKLRLLCVPPACNQEHVFVTRVLTPHDFYIQRNCDQAQIKQIQKSLQVFSHQPARPDEIVTYIRIGELCVACSPLRQWCRVKIIKILKRPDRYTDEFGNLDEFSACSKDDVEILFIDHGRMSKAKVSCLRTLPHKFQRIPPLAYSCSLVGVVPYSKGGLWNEEAISVFSKMVANRPVLMTTVSRDAKQRYVDLHKPAPDEIDNDVPVSVRDALIFLKFARFGGSELLRFDQPLKHRDYFKPTTLPSRSFVGVVLCHFQCISRFFIQQLDSNASYLEDLTHKIQKFVSIKRKNGFDASSPFSIICPYIGMPCLALYECCEMWYRAKITNVFEEEQEIHVLYVDYGNEARISVHDALKIPDIYMKLPYQGIMCQLADIEPMHGQTEWSSESLDRFFELVGEDRQLKMYIKSVENCTYNVELFDEMDDERNTDNTLSVNERLVHEGLAAGLTAHRVVSRNDSNRHCISSPNDVEQGDEKSANLTPSKSESPTGSTSEKLPCYVTVVQCESPASFHVQNKDQWIMSNSLTRDLHKQITEQDETVNNDKDAHSENCCKEWQSGHFCVFSSFQEKRWCRGKVKDVHKMELDQAANKQTCAVYAIDFGFTETTVLASLRELPDEFVSTPPCLTKCFLVNVQPAGGARWTNNAIEAFKELVLNKKCKHVAAEKPDETWESLPVKLYLPSEEDVGRKLVLEGVALPVLKFGSSGSKTLSADSSTPLSRIQLHYELSEAAYQRAENLCLASSDTSSHSQSNVKFPKEKLEDQRCGDAEPASPDVDVSFASMDGIRSLPSAKASCDHSAFPDNIAKALFPPNANTLAISSDNLSPQITDAVVKDSVTSADAVKPEDHCDAKDLGGVEQHQPLCNLLSAESKDTDGRFEDALIDNSEPLTPQKALISGSGEIDVHISSNNLSAASTNTLQYNWQTEIPPAEPLSLDGKFDCIVSHIDQYNVICLKKLPIQDIFTQGKEFVDTAPPLGDFAVGSPCLACFDEDNDWHRAEIAGCESNIPYVRYVDYGLVQRIDDLKRLLVLPTEYVHTPAQAIPCCLASMPTPKQIGMDESDMMAMLANLIGRSTFVCSVVDEKSNLTGLPLVNLYSKDNNVLVADHFQKVLTDAHLPQLNNSL